MQKELINAILTFAENASKYYGYELAIEEAISLNKNNFDRHFTSFSAFRTKLENFGTRFSGNKLFFMGERCNYEIHADRLIELTEIKTDEFLFMERLSEDVYRRTILKLSLHSK